MGVAQKDLKGMADTGQLTTDKIVPALISQLNKLRSEFDSMPNSVSAASTRIQNAFMEWVGGANKASGATTTISGVMDDVSKNINSVATAAGVLVSIGLARYLGGIYSTPQYFAFAKGAGVFGEAGPEAIMPLTRAADGSLGVRAMGGIQAERSAPSVTIGDIHINSQSQQPVSQGAASAAGRQLTDAILRTVNEEVSRPGTPLWRAIKGV